MAYHSIVDGYECIKIWKELIAEGEAPSCAKVSLRMVPSSRTTKPFSRQAIRVSMMNTPGGKDLLAEAGAAHWKGRPPRVPYGKVRKFCMKNEMSTYSDIPGLEPYKTAKDATNQICFGFVPSEALLNCAEWVVKLENGTRKRFRMKTMPSGKWNAE